MTHAGTVRSTNVRSEITTQIVEAVAEAKDVDPLDLDPIYDVINLDALAALFGETTRGQSQADSRVVFSFEECEITVYGDGTVDCSPHPCK